MANSGDGDDLVVNAIDIVVRRGTRNILDGISWQVRAGERWVVLGPNGAGKTTLLLVAGARMFPTSGAVTILDEEMGATDLADLRPRIGWASYAEASAIPESETVADAVLTGAWAVLGRWREQYESLDEQRRDTLLVSWGIDALAERTFGTLSEGERKRTLIARSLMADPELLLLDEPGAGLDLGGREDLIYRLSNLARDPDAPTQVLITHHVEEIPPGFTHALLMRDGRSVAAGPLAEVMTGGLLSETFGVPVRLDRIGDRLVAQRMN